MSGDKPERNSKWCDLSCDHADFPRADSIDGSGSCRTFLALWCSKLDRHVTKNARCQVHRAGSSA